MIKRIILASSILIILLVSGCSSVETIDKLEFNLTDTYFNNQLICYENQCSQEVLIDEKVNACFKGCKINKVGEVDNCFETCEIIYR